MHARLIATLRPRQPPPDDSEGETLSVIFQNQRSLQPLTRSSHLKMSFLGGLFGVSSPQPEKETSASADLFGSTTFRSNVTPSATAESGPSTLPAAPPSEPVIAAPSSLGMLQSSFDVSKLHPMADIGENLDFLALEEDKLNDIDGAATVLPSRGWTDDLCVGTGTTYVSGTLHSRGLQVSPCDTKAVS